MAFPTVVARTETPGGSASTSVVINFTQTTGDLVVIFLAINDTTQIFNSVSDSFTTLGPSGTGNLFVFYKILDGSEGGTLTVTFGSSTKYAAIAYNIQGHANTAPIISNQIPASGTSATPDPGAVTVGSNSKDYLFLAAFRQNGEEADDDTWTNNAPTNYTNLVQVTSGTGGAASSNGSVASAERQLTTVTSENPDTFGTDQSLAWKAYTIAVIPSQRSFAQAQASIKATYRVFAQANAQIKQTRFNVSAQAQAKIYGQVKYVEDRFNRADQSGGWGTPDYGGDWVYVGSTWSVSSNQGIFNMAQPDVDTITANNGSAILEIDQAITWISMGASAGTGPEAVKLIFKGSNGYSLNCEITNSSNTIRILRAAVEKATTTKSITLPARLRMQAFYEGTSLRIRGKMWTVSSGEPSAWDLDYTDPSPLSATGQFGIEGQTDIIGGNVFTLDNYIATDPGYFSGFGQAQAKITSSGIVTSRVYAQGQAFIRKSAGYAQSQARIAKDWDTAVTDLSPTVWWKLGDSSGNFLDNVGTLDLVPTGTPTRGVKNYRIKVDDGAVHFPTASDYLTVADNTALDLGNANWTIAFWARRITDSGGYEMILGKGTNAYGIFVSSGDYFIFTKPGTGILTISDYAVPADGTWHFYVITRASTSDTRMYVDGAARSKTYDDTTTTLSDNASDLHVGHDVTGSDPGFHGGLDELMMWKGTVLTATQIADLYQCRLIGSPDRIAYISTSGNDITGDGSLGSPWFNIPRALTSVCPGDTIQARAGTYNISSAIVNNAYGSPNAPIRVVPYPSEKPIFNGQNSEQVFLLLQNSSWIIVQDIFVQNFKTNSSGVLMINQDSQGNIFRNITVTGTSGTNAGVTDHFIYIGGGTEIETSPRDILIENCWLEGVTGASACNGAGLHIYSDTGGGTPYTGRRIKFRNNLILNIDNGIIAWGRVDTVLATHNTFVNVDVGLRVHRNEVTGLLFKDNLVLGTTNSQLILLTTDGTVSTITEDYNFLSQGGTYATLIYYSEGSGSLNKTDWTALNGNGVHDIVPGSRTDSDFDAGWYPKSGTAVGAASDGFDMGRLNFQKAFAQAQATIVLNIVTVNVNAQSQGWIKATAQKAYAQAQGDIKQTYQVFAQSQADIKAISRGFGQANSDIKATSKVFAQSQADIKATSRVYSQAQADIKQTYQAYAQAQADIKQTYSGYGQAQACVKGNAFAQAQAHIVVRNVTAFAQAQADIKATYRQFAQAQADIKQTYIVCAQAQADIKAIGRGYGQSQADIKQTYQVFAQSNADIKATTNIFAQAQADIKTTYRVFAQANADIKAITNVFAQAQADIKTTYRVFAQAQADIKQVYQAYAQAQANIKATYNQFAQANADIKATSLVFAQAQAKMNAFGVQAYAQALANIKGIDIEGVGQAQAKINAFGVKGYAQAQADIKATYIGAGQAQANIKTTYNVFGQAQAGIKQVYNSFAQAQAEIKQTYQVYAQAQAEIKQSYQAYGQSQSDIKQTYQVFAQAQSEIKQTYQIYGQAQARILQVYYGFAQANADIKAVVTSCANAQADIKQTYQAYAQAQARIVQTYQAYAQAQARILTTYNAFAQAQATIRGNAFAQSQADIKQIYYGFAQAQAQIKQTYFAFAQAQAEIKQTYNAFAQANADIRATDNKFAQAQADIKQVYQVYANAQADILVTTFVFANAQAQIKQTYQSYAQAQADIKATYFAFSQAQADILAVYQVFAQAQGYIKVTDIEAFAQAQADILQIYQGYAQANARIIAFGVNQFAQAQGNIRFNGNTESAQAQAKINAFNYPQHGQAQANVKATYQGYAQAQADIKAAYTVFGQTQADILQAYQGYGQSQAGILQTYFGHAQANALIVVTDIEAFANAQANIRQTYQSYAQANADVLAQNQAHAQAQAQIGAVTVGYGQAQADIKAVSYSFGQANADIKATNNGFGQAQSDIRTTYQAYAQVQALIIQTEQKFAQAQGTILATSIVCGQAQALIKRTEVRCAQAQAQIKVTSQNYGQAQAQIILVQQGYGQSQAQIKRTYTVYAQSQAYIKATKNAYSQAQALIRTGVTQSGQSQAQIRILSQAHGQSNAYIISGHFGVAQAQAHIVLTGIINIGQAQALVVKAAGYGQAQGYILVTHIIKNITIGDRHALNILISDRLVQSVVSDNTIKVTIGDKHALGIRTGHHESSLQIHDRQYEEGD